MLPVALKEENEEEEKSKGIMSGLLKITGNYYKINYIIYWQLQIHT